MLPLRSDSWADPEPTPDTGPKLEPGSAQPLERIGELVQREYPAVWRFLRRLGVPEPDVDDAAQIVLARVLTKGDIIEPASEHAYLMKAAFRFSFEYRRAHRRSLSRVSDVDTDQLDAGDPLPDEMLALRREREMLDHALDELSLELRAVFTLFELEGMTFTEISEALEIPRGTVASRVRRARTLFIKAVRRNAKGSLP